MTEHHMYLRMKELLMEKPIKIQRIEYQRVPDLFFRHRYGGGWVEFKVVNTSGLKVRIPFRPGQFAWIKDYVLLGEQIYLFCIDTNGILWILKNHEITQEYSTIDFKIIAKPIHWTDLTASILFNILGG